MVSKSQKIILVSVIIFSMCFVPLAFFEIYSLAKFSVKNLPKSEENLHLYYDYEIYPLNDTHFLFSEQKWENWSINTRLHLSDKDFNMEEVFNLDNTILGLTCSDNGVYIITAHLKREGIYDFYENPVLRKYDLNLNELWEFSIIGDFMEGSFIGSTIMENSVNDLFVLMVYHPKLPSHGNSDVTKCLLKFNNSGYLDWKANYTIGIEQVVLFNDTPLIFYSDWDSGYRQDYIGQVGINGAISEMINPFQEFKLTEFGYKLTQYREGFLIMSRFWESQSPKISVDLGYINSSLDLVWKKTFTHPQLSLFINKVFITKSEEILMCGNLIKDYLGSGQMSRSLWIKLSNSEELEWERKYGYVFRYHESDSLFVLNEQFYIALVGKSWTGSTSRYALMKFNENSFLYESTYILQILFIFSGILLLTSISVYISKHLKNENKVFTYS